MLTIEVSQNDANYGRIVDGKWYQAEIKPIQVVAKKKGSGENYVFTFSLIGPEDSNGPVMGLEVMRYCPTDKGFHMPIIKAANGGTQPKVGEKINLDALAGMKIDVYVKPQQQEGTDKINNSVEDYAPLGSRTGGVH